MLDIRKRIFIIAGVAIGFILAFIMVFHFVSKKSGTEETVPAGETASESAVVPSGGSPTPSGGTVPTPATKPEVFVPVEKSREVYAKQIARLFVERFTTYSNQNGNVHIDDVLSLVTSQMGKWIETQTVKAAVEYQGVTTNVIASSLTSMSDTAAVVKVDTQQIKSGGGKQETTYLSGTVDLVDANGEWKVEGFYWEK